MININKYQLFTNDQWICSFGCFTDLAVGAPYDGADGHGAVYIYHGSPEGVQVAASQVVYAADIGGHLSTFGYSLSSGLDMDRNGYPGQWSWFN